MLVPSSAQSSMLVDAVSRWSSSLISVCAATPLSYMADRLGCPGFNDKGESIPFQGGTNEEVVDRLYSILRKDKKEQYLKVYWSVILSANTHLGHKWSA